MTSEDLSRQVDETIESLRERILGTGKDQYDKGDTQLIETKTPLTILTETIEEVDDAIVYLAHLRARLNTMLVPLEEGDL